MKKDFITVKNIISLELANFISLEFKMMEDVCKIIYPNTDFADLTENTFARYAPLMMEALSVKILPIIEKKIKVKLYPTYSYARIYYKDSFLQKHFDRQSSEYTVSIALEQTDIWPLYIRNKSDKIYEIKLNIGDGVIYKGHENQHWRDPLTEQSHTQCFLQYVDAEGPHSNLKFDTRPVLGLPFEYASTEMQDNMFRTNALSKLVKL
jgi:hypothetical protein